MTGLLGSDNRRTNFVLAGGRSELTSTCSTEKTMHAEMTAPLPPAARQTTVRRPLLLLFIVAVIAFAYYGHKAGWFDHASDKLGKALVAARSATASAFHKAAEGIAAAQPVVQRTVAELGDAATALLPTAATPTAGGGEGTVVATTPPTDMRAAVPNSTAVIDRPAVPLPNTGIDDRLSRARSAFAAGDVDTAVNSYLALIADNPESISARGELGNVFFAVGMMPAAAQAYFDAASNAIEQNQPDVAENLLPAIIAGNPMLATALNDKLFEARVRADMSRPD
jgi:hypothetical protein